MNAEALIETAKKTPYFHLYDDKTGECYMERYWLKPFDPDADFNIRIHHIMRSDDDRAMHDHPWPSTSIILLGGYYELMPAQEDQSPCFDPDYYSKEWRKEGDVTHRPAHGRHRLVVPDGGDAWTMFIMGKYCNSWGFYDPESGERIYWRDYLNDYDTATSTDKPKKAI